MLNKKLEEKYANPRGKAEIILEKLPAVLKKDSGGLYHQSQTGFQEKTFNRRHREIIAINEWQQKNKETFNQNNYCPPRQYSSRWINSNFDPEPDSMLVRKVDGVDRGFPLKPVYHKRSVSAKDEVQRLPVPSVPSLSGGLREYSGRSGKTENRKPQAISYPSFEDYNNGKDYTGSQQLKGERLPDEQRRLAKEIHKKELMIQNKLWMTGEKLKIQRERVASGDDKHRREERYTRRPAEEINEWVQNKVSDEQRRRDVERGGQARMKKEKSLRREKTLEDTEWPREKREEMNKDRRVQKTPVEDWERWEIRDKETNTRPEWNTERRRRERGVYVDMNDKEIRLEREKKLLWHRWEKEQARAEEERRKLAEEDLDWQRENQWERSRERYVRRDGKRREKDLAPRGKIQENGHQKPAHRGTGSSRSPESSSTSVSNPQSNRPRRDALRLEQTCDDIPLLIACKICQRNFLAERLEKHHQVCEKMQKSNRQVYDSFKHRAKGTELEEFMKTNTRSKTPELKKNNWRVKHAQLLRNMQHAHGGSTQPAPSIQDPDYVTCPYCERRFAPGPAERHVPKCQNIKSRPPPPPRRPPR
ncbi:zinc finger C2HC domain-containing protein 1C [Osmerus eperlanus]|uniref:zinc finger C2HC domain-containing protein 1C n=1 Tax=Osmerus eperlanus TaxID=29151 RepID=UPI002E1456B6